MRVLKLQLHSVIDVITNSSTEIFSFAQDSGIENIKKLFENIIASFDPTVKYEDVIKCIYIVPNDSTKEESIFYKYLKEKSFESSPAIFIGQETENGNDLYMNKIKPFLNIISSSDSISDIEDLIYDFNRRNDDVLTKDYFNMIDFQKFIECNDDYKDYITKEIESYNDDNYEYPMCSTYEIILNDDKYSTLVESIFKIMDYSYHQQAVYC